MSILLALRIFLEWMVQTYLSKHYSFFILSFTHSNHHLCTWDLQSLRMGFAKFAHGFCYDNANLTGLHGCKCVREGYFAYVQGVFGTMELFLYWEGALTFTSRSTFIRA